MIVALTEAVAETCGGKAGALGALSRAGIPVPDGFVIPFGTYRAFIGDRNVKPLTGERVELDTVRRAIETRPLSADLLDELLRGQGELGDPPVAVRSSATNEDTADTSAAGQYESVLGVRGVDEVARAVRACWASLYSPRAIAYRGPSGGDRSFDEPVMAVLVQRLVDADVSGVMFTPADSSGATEIEASWGLGPSVVGGTVTPDAFRVAEDGSVTRTVSHKRTRLDRHGTKLVTHDVPTTSMAQATLDDATAERLARLGHEIAIVLGGPQDIEWALTDDHIWILQSRPVTVTPPTPASVITAISPTTMTGTPGSHGTATGTARIVRGPADFTRVSLGDILVCPYTEPAWTPLLGIAGGVVTETGGVLSHAAIIARERRIPAVLGIKGATTRVHDGTTITIDGTTGTVTTTDA